jgi:hypothetical protein
LHAAIPTSILIACFNLKSVSCASPQQSCGVFKIINLTVIREERYFKEMDLLVKKLYQNKDRYEQFEPHHVDPNNLEEKSKQTNFGKKSAKINILHQTSCVI